MTTIIENSAVSPADQLAKLSGFADAQEMILFQQQHLMNLLSQQQQQQSYPYPKAAPPQPLVPYPNTQIYPRYVSCMYIYISLLYFLVLKLVEVEEEEGEIVLVVDTIGIVVL